jgi:asparagine synthase (glutamine-hydrolysing)
MCGIAGEIRFDGRDASVDAVRRMMRSMKARGPDGDGLVAFGNVAMGHRRLKIIDLSDRGRQPMQDAGLGLTLVFNGCIYNYRALKKELVELGHRFFSDSDTEVILRSYAEWGEKCVERFNGMFAFVIHDSRNQRVFMARDRLGIKPLYYTRTPGSLRFASTLPALVKASRSKPEIDPVSLHHYMSFHSVVPAPRTILESFSKLEPGCTRTFDADGNFKERLYWRIDFDTKRAFESEDAVENAILEQLRSSVKFRMEADVPVGVLLSGGVDSSLVVALLAEAGVSDLNTFSVGFAGAEGESGDEFGYSDIIAKRYATTHHKISVGEEELLSHLPDCILAMSEPMVSHDNIGFYLLSMYVSRELKVVQSGQGADELFGGYFWYRDMEGAEDPVASYSSAFFDRDHDGYRDAVNERYLADDYSRQFVAEHFSRNGAADPVDRALRIDSTVMLTDDPVKRVDNMTMAWGLEARVPFLDHNVVELSAAIAPELKIRGSGKHILKEAARRVIPSEVIDRKKGYFPVPAIKYLDGQVLNMVNAALGSSAAKDRALFKPEYVKRLQQDPKSHITPLGGSKLWQLGTLELWLQAHGI